MRKKVLAFTLLLACVTQAYSSGYQALLQGNRQLAMGNLGVGLQPDPAAIFWNPANISLMKKNGVQIGFNLIDSKTSFADTETPYSKITANTDNPISTPAHLYAVWGIEGSPWKFGLGFYTPFGSTVKWDEDWHKEEFLTELSLQSYYIQPTVSYKISDKFSIGAGLIIASGKVSLKRNLKLNDPVDNLELDGKANWGFGYNLGFTYLPNEKWNIGLNYRSKVDMKIEEGEAKYDVSQTIIDQKGLDFPTSFDGSLPMPSSLSLGAGFMPNEKWTISAEVTMMGWSAYDALTLTFNKAADGSGSADENKKISSSPREYKNAFIYKVGAEYVLNDYLQLRAGTYYDQTPVQDGYLTPETPDQDRLNFTLGLGITPFENFQIDLAYLRVNGLKRTQTAEDVQNAGTATAVVPGTYLSTANVFGLTLTYNF